MQFLNMLLLQVFLNLQLQINCSNWDWSRFNLKRLNYKNDKCINALFNFCLPCSAFNAKNTLCINKRIALDDKWFCLLSQITENIPFVKKSKIFVHRHSSGGFDWNRKLFFSALLPLSLFLSFFHVYFLSTKAVVGLSRAAVKVRVIDTLF